METTVIHASDNLIYEVRLLANKVDLPETRSNKKNLLTRISLLAHNPTLLSGLAVKRTGTG